MKKKQLGFFFHSDPVTKVIKLKNNGIPNKKMCRKSDMF